MEKVNKRLLAIIPYFGGDSSAAPSKVELRPLYLKKCIESLKAQPLKDVEFLIYVSNNEDAKFIKSLNIEPIVIDKIEHPKYLPYEAAVRTQQLSFKADYVILTEADQMWYINWKVVQPTLGEENYYSPLRLEEIYKTYGSARGRNVLVNGNPWAIINTDGLMYPGHRNKINTFGGGFLCTSKAFRGIYFQKSEQLPVEHVTGFSPFNCLKCEMNSDTYVLHLSGYEYHQKLAGVKNETIRSSSTV
jgi:hypothetical protein